MIQELTKQLVELETDTNKILDEKESLLIVNNIFEKIEELDNEAKRLNELKENVREQMTTAFRKNYNGTNDVFEIEGVRVKYTPPTTRNTVDTNVLKLTYPDIYKATLKATAVKDKVTITFKNKGVDKLEVKE